MATKQTNATGYVKDTQTGALINTELNQYKLMVAERKRAKQITDLLQKIDALNERITKLEKVLQ